MTLVMPRTPADPVRMGYVLLSVHWRKDLCMSHCQIIPPYLLEKIAAQHSDPQIVDRARATLLVDRDIRERRMTATAAPKATDEAFFVYDADHGTDLPGEIKRKEGDPETGDQETDEAYAGVQAILAMYDEVYGRRSFDDKGADVRASVHFDNNYDNAFWNGEQLVFGDGDGEIFQRFTSPVDIIGHEFTHAVTQYTAGLTYQGQSGALNESMSDVFGISLKQKLAGQSAAEADWLIGEGIFTPSVHGKALRSMKDPGSAYDDPNLGKDPQVGSMDDYVDTSDDNGGVHTNSGIPNKAFYLAATEMGGYAGERAGFIWYATLRDPRLKPNASFRQFARLTAVNAEILFPGGREQQIVRDAWSEVGVDI
jgi:Zn-dependent metalloprotease